MTRKIVLMAVIPLLLAACSDKNPVKPDNGTVRGKVTADGVGVSGVTITVSVYIVTGKGAAKPNSDLSQQASTADGDYSIELVPGLYKIAYSVYFDNQALWTSRFPVEIKAGEETTINIELKDTTPVNLMLTDDDATVKVTWVAGYGADHHRIYRAASDDNNFEMIREVDVQYPNEYTIFDTPPAIGSYKYKVTALIAGVESEPSDEKTVDFTGSIEPPNNFYAVDLVTRITLTWAEKTNASYYKIYRSDSSPDNWNLIDSVSATAYDDVPGSFGNYYYYVTAVSPYGTESGPSTQKLVNYDGRYDPPSGLTLIDRGSNLYLTWIGVGGSGYYNIYRSLDADSDFVRIDSCFTASYEDVPLLHDFYYYRITVVASNGLESDRTPAVGTFFDGRLDAPSQVHATDRGLWVDVEWDEVPWAGAYIVYRSDDQQTYHQIARVTAPGTIYSDQPPQAGNYAYKVSTETSDGVEGPLSNPALVYFTENLTRPEYVNAESFGTFIVVQWNSVPNATGYTVYRSTSAGGGYVEIGTSDVLQYTDIPEFAGPYYYKVRATDNLGHQSPFSFYTYVYFNNLPLPPHMITANDQGYNISISWLSEDMPYQFIIYRSVLPNSGYVPIDTVAQRNAIDWPSSAGHYYYKLQTVASQDRLSELSSDVHIYFSGDLPAPVNLNADTTGGHVNLSWSQVEGASEYDVFRGPSETQMELLQTVYLPNTTDAPSVGGTYYYAVLARTQGGLESPRSAPVVVGYQP